MWDIILGFVLGAICFTVINAIFHKYVWKEKSVGTLVIDHQSVPEDDPYLFLQLHANPKALVGKKTVVLDVSTEQFVTHK